jgi:phage-related baseplate assembly protein
MRKKYELTKEHTCMQHAHPDEMVFVLLSRDVAAPTAIRAWVAERLRLGKNIETDAQIVDALECARVMEVEGGLWTGPYPGLTLDKAELLYKEAVEVDNG